jgi:transcription initiation factor TFIIIB Brf1 subunit/transcription initiation factor TFIIB
MKNNKSHKSHNYSSSLSSSTCDIDDFDFSDSQIAEIFQSTLFVGADAINERDCNHENVVSFADGRGYCAICGVNFIDSENVNKKCSHSNTSKDECGIDICNDCGQELGTLDFSQEWRHFSADYDTSRCHTAKSNPKGIKGVLDTLDINVPQALAELVELKFNKVARVTGNKILRGGGREAVIAVCLFFAYQSFGQYRTATYIKEKFNLEHKKMSTAFKSYYLAFPDDRTADMTTDKLIPWIMTLTGVGNEHYRRIMSICEYLNAASQLIERSTPQAVAAAVVYFYLCLYPDYKNSLKLSKKRFAHKAMLSDITISKLVAHIAEISQVAVDDYTQKNVASQ